MSTLWIEAAGQASVEPDEYVTHQDLAKMYSGDWMVPMRRVLPKLRKDYRDWEKGTSIEQAHAKDREHGGPDNYIEHLKSDISQNGMHTPIDVRSGGRYRFVEDGNHRGVAAMQLGLDRIPIRHVS